MLKDYLGKEVQIVYLNGNIASGTLDEFDDDYIRLRTSKGAYIVPQRNIEGILLPNESPKFNNQFDPFAILEAKQ
ncbi:hypothetical protein C8Z91_06220 [Paenibacillus elgii]|uniref:LSM domain-containing protein n=1 Tax=Paenibacillus elgii TaxID=189691 RepID=A0A2T6G7F2_9BACL|nr:hypothetical protein [Paenibacillus elgii]PUA40089.1 hypothetical protein C8Z91_06220 [Paenibacillus elgii]